MRFCRSAAAEVADLQKLHWAYHGFIGLEDVKALTAKPGSYILRSCVDGDDAHYAQLCVRELRNHDHLGQSPLTYVCHWDTAKSACRCALLAHVCPHPDSKLGSIRSGQGSEGLE